MTTLFKSFDNYRIQLINGSCIDFVEENLAGLERSMNLIFCDPPFNIGQAYDVHDDKQSAEDFEMFTLSWLGCAFNCLADNGVLVVHIPDAMCLPVLQALQALDMEMIEWVIWHYRFGQCQQEHFIRSKAHALCFVKQGCRDWTFNGRDILVPSDRSSKYSDDRTLDSATPGMRVPLDVWCNEYDGERWGRVTGNSRERWANHPNQLPEKYAERMIKAFTNPDGWIFDMFSGTGTFPTVARALQRCCFATELSADYCEDIAMRIEQGPVSVKGIKVDD